MRVLPWLAQSLDLNPVEHVWDYLYRQMSCLERRSKQTFENALKAKFYSIDKNFCIKGIGWKKWLKPVD